MHDSEYENKLAQELHRLSLLRRNKFAGGREPSSRRNPIEFNPHMNHRSPRGDPVAQEAQRIYGGQFSQDDPDSLSRSFSRRNPSEFNPHMNHRSPRGDPVAREAQIYRGQFSRDGPDSLSRSFSQWDDSDSFSPWGVEAPQTPAGIAWTNSGLTRFKKRSSSSPRSLLGITSKSGWLPGMPSLTQKINSTRTGGVVTRSTTQSIATRHVVCNGQHEAPTRMDKDTSQQSCRFCRDQPAMWKCPCCAYSICGDCATKYHTCPGIGPFIDS